LPLANDADNPAEIRNLKKTLSRLYLEQMNLTKDSIKEYLSAISVARKGECPKEQNA